MVKQLLRKAMRQKRVLFQGDERRLAEQAINDHLHRELCFSGATHDGIMGEVDLSPILSTLETQGVPIYLPRVINQRAGLMQAVRLPVPWREHLMEGAYGIMEPILQPRGDEGAHISLVLVPGVAFDRNLNRLGFGGGFYDRFLPLLPPQTRKLGIAFEFQLVDTIPTETHDCLLDGVCTEKGIYYI